LTELPATTPWHFGPTYFLIDGKVFDTQFHKQVLRGILYYVDQDSKAKTYKEGQQKSKKPDEKHYNNSFLLKTSLINSGRKEDSRIVSKTNNSLTCDIFSLAEGSLGPAVNLKLTEDNGRLYWRGS